jgi:hypothetical protein
MGWKKTEEKPPHGRIYAAVFGNGHYSARAPHVLVCDDPETVEVEWRPRWEVAAETAAIALVGRAHLPDWQRARTGPACTIAEAMAPYTPQKFPGWSLQADTAHGAATPCLDIQAEVDARTAALDAEFRQELDAAVRRRIEIRVPYREIKSKRELVEATVAVNCGISPDYYVPLGWEPSDETWAQAQAFAARLADDPDPEEDESQGYRI